MEILRKTILQAVIIEETITGDWIIIPNLEAIYNIKIGLKQSAQDLGFFDAYVEPIE